MSKDNTREARRRRHARVRAKIRGTAAAPRLAVYRSLNHIYAQVIDDDSGQTLASASTLDSEVKAGLAGKNKTSRAEVVGTQVAKAAMSKGVKQVAFDRGGFRYHGRVKALAEAARKEGLKF